MQKYVHYQLRLTEKQSFVRHFTSGAREIYDYKTSLPTSYSLLNASTGKVQPEYLEEPYLSAGQLDIQSKKVSQISNRLVPRFRWKLTDWLIG